MDLGVGLGWTLMNNSTPFLKKRKYADVYAQLKCRRYCPFFDITSVLNWAEISCLNTHTAWPSLTKWLSLPLELRGWFGQRYSVMAWLMMDDCGLKLRSEGITYLRLAGHESSVVNTTRSRWNCGNIRYLCNFLNHRYNVFLKDYTLTISSSLCYLSLVLCPCPLF